MATQLLKLQAHKLTATDQFFLQTRQQDTGIAGDLEH